MSTAQRDHVLAVLKAAVTEPNEYSTDDAGRFPPCRRLARASDPRWTEQVARARQQDRDITGTMAALGRNNQDDSASLCATQCEQRRAGVEDVRVSRWIRGWAVRTDWADSQRVFLGYSNDPTEAIVKAMEWQSLDLSRRGVLMYGDDYLAALAHIEAQS